MKSFNLLLGAVFFLAACKSGNTALPKNKTAEQEKDTTVIQPIRGLEITPSIYEVIAESPAEISLPNGGKIHVPANAFVDLEGNPIKGKVDLEWTEFHSLTDIMLSGIPMKYDSAGMQHNFVSGGMFTLNAKQKNTNLAIQKGKALQVDLVSTDDTPCYNFYQLNEKTGTWEYETTKAGEFIPGVKVKKENPTNEQDEKRMLIDCEVDYSHFDELKGKNIIAWEPTEKLSLDEKRRIENNVAQLSLEKDETGYFLDFKRKTLSSKLRVQPFLIEDAARTTATLKDELNADYAALRTYYQDLANGKVVRSISIENFGTYNWDVIYRSNDIQTVFAAFDYGSQVKNPELVKLYYLCLEANLIVNCSPVEDKKFFFSPKKKNALLAVLPNNEIYVLNNTGFREIAGQRGRANYTFHLKPSGKKAESGGDVSEIAKELFQ